QGRRAGGTARAHGHGQAGRRRPRPRVRAVQAVGRRRPSHPRPRRSRIRAHARPSAERLRPRSADESRTLVATQTRALFDRLPRLADLVPFTALADGLPTPVQQVDERLWVQREESTSSTYGGNKVRKFEFLFPVAERRGGPMLTAGGVGSHHVLAAAVHANRLGLDVDAVLYRQPDTDDVARTRTELDAMDNLHVTRIPSPYLMPAAIAARLAALASRRPYLLWPGAST